MPVSQYIELPRVNSGEIIDLSVELIAPSTTGSVISYWQLQAADGTPLFPHMKPLHCWVRVICL
jgi:hypothetical protein